MKKFYVINFIWKKTAFAFLAVLFCLMMKSECGSAQVSAYAFSQASGTYTNQAATGLTNVSFPNSPAWDDDVVSNVTLPFTFTYNSTVYNSINISSNGFITFGAAPSSTNYTPISTNTAGYSIIAPLGKDLAARNGTFGATWASGSTTLTLTSGSLPPVGTVISGVARIADPSTVIAASGTTITLDKNTTGARAATNTVTYYSGVLTQTTGSAPNRKFYIQWTWTDAFNVNTQLGSNLNFQIILNETTNDINVIYGTEVPNTATSLAPQVGLRGTANTDYNNRTGSTWAASTAGATNAATMTLNTANVPSSGQTYTWSSPKITTGTITPLTYCAGNTSATVSVPFTSVGTYTSFTVQLSNSSGSFSSPVNIGTGTTSPISVTITAGTAAGAGYRIKVISTTPAVTGTDNGSNITINNPAAPTGSSPQSFCASAAPTVANLLATGSGIQWYAAAAGGAPLASTTTLTNGTQYFASQTISGCEGSVRLGVTVALTSPASPTGSATQLFCSDANPTVNSLTATGTNIKWYLTSTGGTALTGSTGLTNSTNYYASQTVAGCESTTRLTVAVTIYQSVVTTDPSPSSQTRCAGSNITYSVSATGSGLSYQWQKNGSPISNGGNITGATTTSLHINNIASGDAGDYSVIVSGTSPCSPVSSAAATLIVDQKIIFTVQPLTPQTICQGQTYTVSATATGTVATSIWNQNGSYYANATVSGNTYSLTIPAVVAGDAGSYQLVLDDGTGIGCSIANSGTATLNVTAPSVGGSVSADATVCYGTNSGTLTLSGKTGSVVRWEYSTDGGANWITINNTSTSQSYSNLTITTLYRAVVQNGVCASDNSSFATITVNPVLAAGIVGSDQAICYNTIPSAFTSTTLPVGGTGLYTYQWQSSPNGTTWSNISGATATTYAPAALTATTYYRRNETSGTCGTVSSNVITVTVYANLTAGTIAVAQTICYNTAPAAFTSTGLPTGGTGTYSYQWQSSPDNSTWTDISGATAATYGPGTLTTTTYYRRNATSGTCGTASTASLKVTVNPVLTAGTVGSNQTICYNTAPATFTNTASPTGGTGSYTYQWQSSPDNATWSNASGTNTNATYTSGALTAMTYFRRNETSGTCGTVTSNVITITVNANLIAGTVAASQAICYNTIPSAFTSTTLPVGGTGLYTYQWQSSPNGTTWSNISGATATTYAPAALTATTYYRRNETSGTCGTVSSNVITVTVYANLTAGTIAVAQTICYNTAPAAFTSTGLPTGGTGTYSYQWQSSPDNSTWTDISGATAATYGPGTLTTTTYYRRNATSGTCGTASTASLKVTVNPVLTSGTVGSNQTICYNTAPTTFTNTASPTGGTGSYTYQWQSSPDNATWSNASGTNTNATYTSGALTAMTYFRRNETSGTCGTVTSNVITVSINPLPTITTTGIAAPKCFSASAQNSTLDYTATTQSPTTYSINWVSGITDVTNAALPASPIIIPIPAGRAAGTYTGTLTVKNANGCISNGIPVSVTIYALPTPTLTNNPASPVCANTNVTYTTDPGQSNYIWTFSGTGGIDYTIVSGGNSTSNTAVIIWKTTGTKTVTINYTNSNTCTAVTPTSNNITVLAVPTGNVAITENSGTTANDNKICAGDAVIFTAPDAGTGATYTFYVNGIKVQGPSTNKVYSTITLPGGAVVTVDIANGNNCGSTLTAPSVTVNPLPTATLAVTENSGIANDNSICPNASVTLTAGAGGTSYSFLINGTAVATSASNIYTTTSIASNSTVAVMVTNSNGCQATSATQSITVTTVPGGTLTVSPGNSFCAGTSATFTATAGAGNIYNFKVNGVSKQNTSSNTYTTTTLTNGQVVSVDVTNSNGCTTTFNVISITVNAIPTGTLSAAENSGTPDDNSICSGTPVIFTATSGYASYDFQVNGVSKQNTSANTYTNSTLLNSDIVKVMVTSGSSCTATFNTVTITVVPSPTGTLSVAPSNSVCIGNSVTFTATAGYTSYDFQVNGTSVQNSTASTFSTTSLANGDVVSVDVTNSNSCVTTFNTITMQVSPLPTGTLAISENSGNASNDAIICAGASVTFTAPNGFTNYNFLLNGTSIQNSGTKTYTTTTLANNDIVTVSVTNAGGCIGLLNQYTITVNPLPAVAPITGNLNVCESGGTTILNDATTGGVWISEDISKATVNAATGVVTGVAAGTVIIDYTYTNSNSCSNTVTTTVTVHALPAVQPITGNFNICTNNDSQLSDVTPGGIWSSSNTGVATVDPSTGLVHGAAQGTATISYTVTDSYLCSTTVTADVTVSDFPTVAPITTTSPSGFNVCVGSTLPLKDATSGGTWSVVNGLGTATITTTGVLTGVSAGDVTVYYSIISSCGLPAINLQTVNVNPPPSASISYTGSPYCSNSGTASVTQTGTTGGTYTKTSGAGTLSINSSTGDITLGTSTAGTYTVTYSIAASGGCGVYTTNTSITITPAPSATISYSGSPYCSNSGTATVTQTGATGGAYTKTAGAGTLSLNVSTGAITLSTSTPGTYTVTYTIAASGGCSAFTTTASITITAAPSATISYPGSPFCKTSGTVNPTLTGTTGGTYSSTAGLTINAAGTITPSTSTAGTYTVTYTVGAAGGCSVYTATTLVSITAAPTAAAGDPVKVCSNASGVSITSGASATNSSSILWSSSGSVATITNPGSLTGATYTPSAADISAGSVTLTLQANGNGNCGPTTSTKTLTIYTPPPAFVLTPSGTINVCQGNVQPLTATGNTSSTGSVTISSGNINLAIPDATFFGLFPGSVTNNLAVSTVPAGAIINSMSVNFNINHTYDGDLLLNLKAPNGKILNLVDQKGRSGDNFTNTTVSSTSANPFLNGAGNAPFTGTFIADGDVGVGTPNSNNAVFSGLFTTPNGTWTFGAEDDGSGDVGTILNWSLTFNYTIPNASLPVTWSPITDLYTDAGATTTYTGMALSTVYAKPASSGTKVYTATATNAAGCSISQNVSLIVGIVPVVTVSADYCAVAGKVKLTATSTPTALSYLWNTGETTQSILVDVSGIYTVTVYASGSTCPGKGTINVANELVKNGNFEAGNVGFTSSYPYRTGAGSLNNPPGYAVDTAANYYGPTFLWGKDHTTTHGKFMMVNGAAGANYQIWQETLNVLPNTTYYFSAWGLELDNLPSPPTPANATLQFNVNGVQTGTLGNLPRPNNPTRDEDNNQWVRFYGSWTSGPTTTSAVVSITDLQGAVYGNNFGLDDISFGTLSTFVNLESAAGTDVQTVCANTAITNIVYSAGSSASSPTVTGLPAGVTSSWNGVFLTISGTPTVSGNYSYTVTTTGSCLAASASGTITVQAQKIALSSGSSTPSVCLNNAMPNIVYTLSGPATGATVTGLPPGVTGVVSGSGPTYTYTISGTPTSASGSPYSYTVTTSGSSCTPVTAIGTITIQSQTIALNTGDNDNQTVCLNSAIANIRYNVGGTATGATITGLPPGVTGSYNGGIFTIIGSPSTAAGSPFNYMITTTPATGACNPVTITGKITVTPGASFVLTTGTNPQPVCKGVAMSNITYTVSNATGASISGLPTGTNGSYSGGLFTISGTPTAVAGTYNYIITSIGGCGTTTVNGSITVQVQTIILTSAPGSASPTVCANTAMPVPIVYTIGGTATGASVTGLPAGVTGTLSGKNFTIAGTPTAAGSYSYIVSTSGTCTQVTATGTITVTATNTVGAASSSPTVCINTAIPAVTHITTGVTGIGTPTGLPAGVSASFASNTITISGTPSAPGTFNYSIPLTGGCGSLNATGTITVTANNTVSAASSTPTVCVNTGVLSITHTTTGATGIGLPTGLPASVTASFASNTITISGTPTASGIFNYSIPLTGGCGSIIATGTITVTAAAVGGTLTSVSVCSGASGTLTLSGQSGTIQRWEFSTDDGTTWTTIVNTTASQNYTNITTATQYRVLISTGCTPVYSTVATIGIHNLWVGGTSSDWNTASNWSDGQVPTFTPCLTVTIPMVTSPNVYPILSYGTGTATNLVINMNASLTVTTGVLQIAGTITNNGMFNLSGGTIEMVGTAPQTIAAGTFQGNDVKNLILTNTSASGVTLAGPVNLYGKLSFGNNDNQKLVSAGNLNLRSTAAGTAIVTDVTNNNANTGNIISGNVVVERYYPGRRAWRLVTAPVSTTRTIFNEWQVGGMPASVLPSSGTYITSPTGGNGLDVSLHFSLKKYNDTTGLLVDVMNTKVPISRNLQQFNIPDNIGYFMFVRGDRTPSLLNPNPITNYNITTLRDTGILQTGKKTFTAPNAGFMLVGNPYASPIDFSKLTRTSIPRKFWAWDPRLNNTLGAYVVVDGQVGNFIVTPGPDPVPLGSTGQDSIIQSSQAIFVQSTAASATIEFNENSKSVKDNNSVFRPAAITATSSEVEANLRANLYLNDPDTAILADGVYIQFRNDFSIDVDDYDALKFTNFLENLGISEKGKTLTLERRPLVTANDTIFFKLWNTTARSYQFRFSTNGLSNIGLEGFLEDSYLKTSTPVDLNGYTNVTFSVTSDAASKATNRFRIVFKPLAPLPISFSKVKAYQQGKDINIEWTVENEKNMKQYEVERSLDSYSFTKIGTVAALHNDNSTATYQWPDESVNTGTYYYRIHSYSVNGQEQYSNVVKVTIEKGIAQLYVYPNPVVAGDDINIHFINQPKGRYGIRLTDKIGQVIAVKQVEHAEGNSTEKMPFSKTLAHGTYQLEITKPDNTKKLINLLY